MKTLPLLTLAAVAAASFAGLTFLTQKAEAQQIDTVENASSPLIVAELFTSQSCSSCPPAEALFSQLADREDLLTIEWHVDYWDDLIHHGSRWKDLYSHEDYTRRQRSYNRNLRGTGGVYTPQAIVNGDLEGAGNRRSAVSNMISLAPQLTLPVNIADGTVTVGPNNNSVEVLFVRLLNQHVTNVKGGENKGRKLFGKNIVLEAEVLGQTGNKPMEFKLPKVGEGESCAVLVQSLSRHVGPVLGAAKCG